jgi:hypothetical protein
MSNLYLIVTGAIWVTLVQNTFHMTIWVRLSGFVLHFLVSLPMLFTSQGLSITVIQRLNFLNTVGERYWPDILRIGAAARTAAGSMFWRLGEPRIFWAIIPAAGMLGDVVLGGHALYRHAWQHSICNPRLALLLAAEQRYDVERAIYLLDKANCELLDEIDLSTIHRNPKGKGLEPTTPEQKK